MSLKYKCIKLYDAHYLIICVNGETYISSDPCDEWIQVPLITVGYISYEDTLVLTLGSETWMILRKWLSNSRL